MPPVLHRKNLRSPAFRWFAGVAFALASWWSLFTPTQIRYRLDTDVYRLGALRFWEGNALYEGNFRIIDDIFLPFTYPPISAVAFLPLTPLTAHGASLVFGAVNLLVLFAICWILLWRVVGLSRTDATWSGLALAAAFSFFGPVLTTLHYGQINLVLALMILLDATLVPPRYRGFLTGCATALKLTPAVFGLWFLLRRDFASVIRMGIGAAGLTAIGFAVMPGESMKYWFGTLQSTDRIGGLEYASNQSISGELWRLGLRDATSGTWLWIILVLVALAVTVALMLRLFRQGLPLLALCVNGFFGVLASPVSWAHHFVWVAIALVIMAAVAQRGKVAHERMLTILVALGVVCYFLNPATIMPDGDKLELGWNTAQHVIGNAYLWWIVLAYVVLWRGCGFAPVRTDSDDTPLHRRKERVSP